MLNLYNTLTHRKELFQPIHTGKVGIYVCGVTVYDHCHLGHGRSMVSFDMIVRYFRACGYQVTYIRNITDIDDKIIARAHERGVSIDALTSQYIDSMHADMHALSVLPADQEPRATQYIPHMMTLIQRLLDNGHAYVNETGDVCYQVDTFASYGKLSHKDITGLLAGARVEVTESKRSPLDFVLWKAAKPHEPSWPSPWGPGRPGWHIECSAMAMDTLGEPFDVHGGGLDLQFPHHENEIAQSEGATGKPFANYWLHVGMLQINQEKMAKSRGNFLTIEAVLAKYHPEVLRYFFLSCHYRSPLNFSDEALQQAKKSLNRLYQALRSLPFDSDSNRAMENHDATRWTQRFHAAMQDDFNTPEALAVLFELSHVVNKSPSLQLGDTLKQLGGILGILQAIPDQFLQETKKMTVNIQEIEQAVALRNQARASCQWTQADTIRQELLARGIVLEDGPQGTTWRMLV